MYAALRSGNYINNGEYMAKSTLMAIMARDAAYTGHEVTMDQMMMAGQQLVDVANLTWESKLPEWRVAMPGQHSII